MYFQLFLHRFRWLHLPAGLLVMLLQRTPVLRLLAAEGPGFGIQSADILKSAVALVAMGAYNSVAGATVFNATPTAPTTVTPASGPANTTFTATGAANSAFSLSFNGSGAPSAIKSWKVTGTLPAGLTVTGGTAVTGGILVNALRVTLAGTPTTGGSRTLTFTAYSSTGATGDNAKVTSVINITSTSVAPTFSTHPLTQTVNAGATVTFTAAASGTPTPTLQWFKGVTAISGQTGTTLTLTNVQPADAGSYSVKATNSAAPSGVSANTATLTVIPIAPLVSIQRVGASYEIKAPSTTGVSYQLQGSLTLAVDSWTPIGTAQAGTGAVLTFSDTPAISAPRRFYRLVLVPVLP